MLGLHKRNPNSSPSYLPQLTLADTTASVPLPCARPNHRRASPAVGKPSLGLPSTPLSRPCFHPRLLNPENLKHHGNHIPSVETHLRCHPRQPPAAPVCRWHRPCLLQPTRLQFGRAQPSSRPESFCRLDLAVPPPFGRRQPAGHHHHRPCGRRAVHTPYGRPEFVWAEPGPALSP